MMNENVSDMEKQPATRESLIDTISTSDQSALEKYQSIYVGSRSWLALLRYEIYTTLLAPLPGALGFFLRKSMYKGFLAQLGRGSAIGPNVTLRCPGSISLGASVFLDNDTVLDAKGPDSSIQIGNSVLLGKGTIFSCASAAIQVGNEVSIGPHCYIRASRGAVELGSYLTIGAHSVIISGNPDYKRLDVPMMKQVGPAQGISVGDDVWMGVGVRIVDGVRVGTGSVIGAGAVVIDDVPDFAIVAGVPARVLGERE
jgi:acetyltransferase-like isoleucine patch superfamily enzyme